PSSASAGVIGKLQLTGWPFRSASTVSRCAAPTVTGATAKPPADMGKTTPSHATLTLPGVKPIMLMASWRLTVFGAAVRGAADAAASGAGGCAPVAGCPVVVGAAVFRVERTDMNLLNR